MTLLSCCAAAAAGVPSHCGTAVQTTIPTITPQSYGCRAYAEDLHWTGCALSYSLLSANVLLGFYE